MELDNLCAGPEPKQVREDIQNIIHFICRSLSPDHLDLLVGESGLASVEIENLAIKKLTDWIRNDIDYVGPAWYPFNRSKGFNQYVDMTRAAYVMIAVYKRYRKNEPILMAELIKQCLMTKQSNGWERDYYITTTSSSTSNAYYLNWTGVSGVAVSGGTVAYTYTDS